MERGRGQLPLVNHFLQHTLRSLCREPLHWVYSIFWRILPRHYPPPVWENEAGPYDRNKGNKRNWILVWEDGYCDFVACSRQEVKESKKESKKAEGDKEEEEEDRKDYNGPLEPELFFKLSHDVYNYGEGLMGKIASEKSHKWIFRDPTENKNVPLLSAWHASTDSYPRTWEAQFKAGIQTIAIIAVGEGLLQLGSTKKVQQDVDFVLMLQRKFSYLQSIPGVFAQTKITMPINCEGDKNASPNLKTKQLSGFKRVAQLDGNEDDEACSRYPMIPLNLVASTNPAVDVPSMYNSLQALLSKLPAVTPNVPVVDVGKVEVVAAVNASPSRAAEASSRRVRATFVTEANPVSTARLPTGGQGLPLTTEVWPADPRRSRLLRPLPLQPPPPSTLASANTAIPNLSDDFESYHSLFGQLIS